MTDFADNQSTGSSQEPSADPSASEEIMPELDPILVKALGKVIDPEIRKPITELNMVQSAELESGLAKVAIQLTIIGCPAADRITQDVAAALTALPQVNDLQLTVGVMSPKARQDLLTKLRGSKQSAEARFGKGSLTRVIAITSGKGGVGKSSVTANLAVQLAEMGFEVGLVDADIHGFSIPDMLGLHGAVPTRLNDLIVPPVAYGVKTISIGMFLQSEQAIAWRGPMLHRALKQFLEEVYFGAIDFLLIDLPPGTGDIAISLGQLLPAAEVLVITTPQATAAGVAVRSGMLAKQSGQKIIGVVENMGPTELFNQAFAPFGSGGGRQVAEKLSELGSPITQLASIPFDPDLSAAADSNQPIQSYSPASAAAIAIARLAEQIVLSGDSLLGKKLPLST